MTPRLISARSEQRFPSLAPPSCPWHDHCTPMDCENFRSLPDTSLLVGRHATRVGRPHHR